MQSEIQVLLQSNQKPESRQNGIIKTQKSEKDEKQVPNWLAQEEEDLLDVEMRTNPKQETPDEANHFKKTLSELMKPSAYKPFLLLLAVFVLQQSTGSFAVIFYAVNVFKVNNWLSLKSAFVFVS